MKKLCSLIVLCLFVSLPAKAEDEKKELGFWVEAQTVSQNPSRLTVWYEKAVTKELGFFANVGKESDGYRQFYVGPTWKPVDWLQLGLGVGRETVPGEFTSPRRAFFFEANGNAWQAAGYFEKGMSGRWHKVTATYAITEQFGAGVMTEKYLGFGPRVEYNIEDTKIQLWGAVLHDKKSTFVLGINVSF